MLAPAPASSTTPTTTMNAFESLNSILEEDSTTPRPISLRTISSANANVMSVTGRLQQRGVLGIHAGRCSAAMAAVLTRMSRVTNVSKARPDAPAHETVAGTSTARRRNASS